MWQPALKDRTSIPSPNPRNDNNYSEIGVRTHVVGYLRWMEWNARCLRVRLITINLANYCLALFWPFGGCKLQVYHSSWGHGRSFAAIDTVFWSGSSYRRSTHCGLIVFEIMIRRNFRSAATRTWKWKSLKRVSRVSSLAYDDGIRATIGMGKWVPKGYYWIWQVKGIQGNEVEWQVLKGLRLCLRRLWYHLWLRFMR